MQSTNITTYKITTDSFVRFFVVLAGISLIWILKDIIISILVSVVIASAISPFATKMSKLYIPRSITVFTILASMVATFVAIFVLLVPLMYNEFSSFTKSFYVFQRDTINYVSGYTGNKQLVSEVIRDWSIEDIQNTLASLVTVGTGALGSTASAVTYFLFQTVLVFVISFYLAVQERGVERFLRIITPSKKENYIINLWERSQKKIVSWAKGQMLLAFLVGILVYIGLSVIELENAILFALLAAVGEVIPIVGMMIASIPVILFALVSGGVETATIVALFYLLITQFENHVLAPMIVNKVVGIPSVIVIIALVSGGILAGFWGVLLAVPVAAVIMEYVGDIEESKKKQIESIASVENV